MAVSLGVVAGVWALNTSLWLPKADGQARLIAHRGVHQTYAGPPPGPETCTATPIEPATHGLIENTIPSMRAAFEAGADVVELDVHRTPDGVLAVFHDWTLDCRTDGSGQTNKTPWTVLKTLDMGHGYSLDGVTFPLRGSGIGAMPRLEEVFDTFPEGRFLVNFKSNRGSEGKALVALLETRPDWIDRVWGVYGGVNPTARVTETLPGLRGFHRAGIKSCLLRYAALGWSGHVPKACRDTVLLIPDDVAPWLWGWPRRFLRRMDRAGTDVIMAGPFRSTAGTNGIDTVDAFTALPDGFGGHVWTNRIERIGPARAGLAR
ncbi:glycerophosphodiester phosphodiesterase family protein [Pseudaestuariivita atlantica]|uniref:glycerophosphodiester phosphodiesterase family protein n=1 Tax=Pseudaestuariivita atlantica TaxID=1317121 RepID=UPI001F5F9F27|nr:glycerophosphodiester phosphodiesterase family protein [Pseudaestuariivita atlantica]